jgi:hypothetical protein
MNQLKCLVAPDFSLTITIKFPDSVPKDCFSPYEQQQHRKYAVRHAGRYLFNLVPRGAVTFAGHRVHLKTTIRDGFDRRVPP